MNENALVGHENRSCLGIVSGRHEGHLASATVSQVLGHGCDVRRAEFGVGGRANSAWLVLTVIAFNLLHAAGTIASLFHARATTGTFRAQLISVAARIIKSARRI